MLSVPDEILQLIFLSLPTNSIFVASQVCKRWNNLCNGEDLWKIACRKQKIEKPDWEAVTWQSFYRIRAQVVPRLRSILKTRAHLFKKYLDKTEREFLNHQIAVIFNPPYEAFSSLLDKQKNDKYAIDQTIRQLFTIFHWAGDDFALFDLTKQHIEKEVKTLSEHQEPKKLFRSKSVVCRLFIELSYLVSSDYMQYLMGSLIQANPATNTNDLMQDFEDDSYKSKLATTTEEFLNKLYNSVDRIPILIREILFFVYISLKPMQIKEDDILLCLTELFVFRMIIPGMLSSQLYGVKGIDEITPMVKTTGTPSNDVIGIAQILRNVSCNMQFGNQSQKYFMSLNPLVDTHHTLMKEFLLKTVQLPQNQIKNFTINCKTSKKKEVLSHLSLLVEKCK